MRLRTLLAAAFGLLALALTLAGSLFVERLASKRLHGRIGTEFAGLATQIRTLLDQTMFERWSDMQVLSSLAGAAPAGAVDQHAWVEALHATYPLYAWLGFTDRNGRVTASVDGLLEGADVALRPWFQEGLKGPHVGDVHEALLLAKLLPPLPSGEPQRFVDVAAPMRDAAGETIGVVAGHLSWTWAEQVAATTLEAAMPRGGGVQALVLGRDGTVLLGPKRLQGARLPPMQPRLQAGEKQGYTLEAWPDGVTYLVGASLSTGFGSYPGLGWTVLVIQPAEIAFAPARRLSGEIMLGGALFTIVFAIVGWFAASLIARPLLALTRVAEDLSHGGGLPTLAPARGVTEVRTLTETLTLLLARLAERDEALETANRTLEAQVEERTRALEQRTEALQVARDAAQTARLDAERASLAKTDFLAAMSHEIRTPLNAVIGFTDLLAQSEDLAPIQRRHAEFARNAGSALLTVVDDILDFSKVEAGAIELEARPFSPSALVETGLSIVRDLATRKGLAVRVEIDPALPEWLVGDEDRLRQILLNLLNNAVKFTRHGSVTLRAEHHGSTAVGERVRFSVTDTGIGIPPEKQSRLFERFSQVDSSVTRDFGGTGLGLAICKRLVELMEGTIGVSSQDGAGATFWVSLTLPRGSAATASTVAPVRLAPRRTGHILLVEDVELNQELARLVLEAAGHSVAVVGDGAAAVMAVRDGDFDLVLMDVQMPGMDGMTATRTIRDLKSPAARIPVIAMTANVLPDEVSRFRQAGMDDHVGKPFDRATLYATIDRWLADERRIGEVTPARELGMEAVGERRVRVA